MNRDRYDALEKARGVDAPAAYLALFLAARNHAVTIDAVVQAGLGRGAPDDAARAAQALKDSSPDFFEGLAELWPFVCGACSLDASRVNVCPTCRSARVCDGCLGRHGCPSCTAKARAALERRQTATADMEANAKWVKRQLAAPLPEDEDAAGEQVSPPEPPPDPPEPPDPTEHVPGENIPGMAPATVALLAESPPEGVE